MTFFNPLDYGSGTKSNTQEMGSIFGTDYAPPISEKPTEALLVFVSHVRSVGVAYLLLLWFGYLGAHRFYLRGTKSGFTMMVLSGASVLVLSKSSGFDWTFAVPIALALWLVIDALSLANSVRQFNRAMRDRISNGGNV